jgi:NADPH:quinone reductase-like Zn-dependent oxidoreductase
MSMLVAGVRAFGGEVEMLEVDEPRSLAAEEVLIDVRSAGIGDWDNIIRSGDRDVGTRPPMALGVEALSLHGGETVLVHGAGGLTGGLIVQLAALRGVDVLATASPRSADRVRVNGAREVIDYRDPTWPQHAKMLAKGDIDAVANAAPGGRSCSLDQAASALAQVVAGHESSGVVITKDI